MANAKMIAYEETASRALTLAAILAGAVWGFPQYVKPDYGTSPTFWIVSALAFATTFAATVATLDDRLVRRDVSFAELAAAGVSDEALQELEQKLRLDRTESAGDRGKRARGSLKFSILTFVLFIITVAVTGVCIVTQH